MFQDAIANSTVLSPQASADFVDLRAMNDNSRRFHSQLSVQSINYNPVKTHLEDIMQERLEEGLQAHHEELHRNGSDLFGRLR